MFIINYKTNNIGSIHTTKKGKFYFVCHEMKPRNIDYEPPRSKIYYTYEEAVIACVKAVNNIRD